MMSINLSNVPQLCMQQGYVRIGQGGLQLGC